MTIPGGYKNVRLKHYDYHTGWFFVTNQTDLGRNYFTGNLYKLVKDELIKLVEKTEGVGLDYFQIMPNHIHIILEFDQTEIPLSEFWRRFKAVTTLRAKRKSPEVITCLSLLWAVCRAVKTTPCQLICVWP